MPTTEELAAQQTIDFRAEFIDAYDALFLTREELQELRTNRLRDILRHAKLHSPWYQKRLAHIDVDTFTEQQLVEIPPMNREMLMAHWDEIVTHPGLTLELVEKHVARLAQEDSTLYFRDRYHVLVSSDSSAKRGVFIYDWREWNICYASIARYIAFRAYKAQQNRPEAAPPARKTIVAQIVATNAAYALYSFGKTYNFDNMETHYLPMTAYLPSIIANLNRLQADVIIGLPTALYKLCMEAEAGRLQIEPKSIVLGGETFYRPIRERAKKQWPHTEFFNTYGAPEGFYMLNCHADTLEMHVNEDLCIMEPVDKFNNAVAKGVLSDKWFLTNLYNYTLPLIRYEINERVRFLDKTCDCGIPHQLMAEPEGVPELNFTYAHGIYVHHLVFVTPLMLTKNLHEFQVQQTQEGANIKIVLKGDINKEELKNRICAKLSELGLPNPEVNLLEVDEIEYPASGKLRRFLKMADAE